MKLLNKYLKMMSSCSRTPTHLLFLLLLSLGIGCLQLETIKLTSGNEEFNYMGCTEKDRKALLVFKEGLNDSSSGRLSSWVSEDCCRWRGIACNKKTGRVVKLDLKSPLCNNSLCLSGKINPSLLYLKHLNYLDLSMIDFEGISIPEFIGSLKNLKYLNLSNACFAGKIPPHLGNLSRLHKLDLHGPSIVCDFSGIYVENLEWLSSLSSLKHLDMGDVDLNLANNNLSGIVPHCLGNMTALISNSYKYYYWQNKCINLVMKGKELEYIYTAGLVKSIDFSINNLTAEIPEEKTGLLKLGSLNLSINSLTGKISEKIRNLKMLETLDLSRNQLFGSIPQSLSSLSFMSHLNLSYNNLSGKIPLGNQLQTLNDPSIYEGNQALCGPPLVAKYLGDEASQGPSSIGDNGEDKDDEDGSEMLWFCTSMALGFIGGFWGVCVNVARLKRKMKLEKSQGGPAPEEGLELGNEDRNVGCAEKDRKALLEFKEDLNDSSGWLSSWVGEDCCSWRGVGCIKKTGRVMKLDLRNSLCNNEEGYNGVSYERPCLSGKINPSLLHLEHLNYLDLSMNNFKGISIPDFIGSLENLKYLNLSNAYFAGKIPPHLGNLSRLHYLDLHDQSYSGDFSRIYADNLKWLSGLSSLKYLDMGHVNLSQVGADWLQAFNMLPPSLSELHLPACRLDSLPLSLPFVNFSSLLVLDLSHNLFQSSMPLWLFNISSSLANLHLSNNYLSGSIPDAFADMTSLQELDLSYNDEMGGEIPRTLGTLCNLKRLDLSKNRITGEITKFVNSLSGCTNSSLEMLDLGINQLSGYLPDSIGHLKKLRFLRLNRNSFWGSIPTSIGSLSFLKELDLSVNHMNGTIPKSVGQLSELVFLDLSYNSWEGIISEVHFLNLMRLKEIDISLTSPMKSLIFNARNDWIPPFSLKSIWTDNVQMSPSFPAWLQTQKELNEISLNNVGISDTIPDWFWKLHDIRGRKLDLKPKRAQSASPALQLPHHVTWRRDLLELMLSMFFLSITAVRAFFFIEKMEKRIQNASYFWMQAWGIVM
ncbi:hypothetical protein HHK36_029323 [Tetracentron sinense]|uniref:Leucine-rich repeat-containing N-terminal plant-type domain-containing protein n=1 Tax=Tetracentron sinense TaxID=13715 RepID=A0A834YCS5_TETSI|nr:hypothetical protein HHK36_029323 [Tetracentron sinense]